MKCLINGISFNALDWISKAVQKASFLRPHYTYIPVRLVCQKSPSSAVPVLHSKVQYLICAEDILNVHFSISNEREIKSIYMFR